MGGLYTYDYSARLRADPGENELLSKSTQRWLFILWLTLIAGFALLHALNLRADFPNHTPWHSDWAKYTDEGWYGNAAIRAHLFGHWYLKGDFNPAVAAPAWPFLEWLLFFVTGVTVEAARGLAVAMFFANLLLIYLLLRNRGSKWMPLLALTFIVTSPFLYCFSRLAILEPLLITLTLGALNLALRLPRLRRPAWGAAGLGIIFALMMLTKATAVFLLPALVWAILIPLWPRRALIGRCALSTAATFAAAFGVWITLVAHYGLLADYRYLFVVNKYPKPKEFYWPLVSLWWSIHGGLWVDHILIPLAGLVTLGALFAGALLARHKDWASNLLQDPAFGASILAVAGYLFFMTYQYHPQPRYFAVVSIFSFMLLAQGVCALLDQSGWPARAGWSLLAVAALATLFNAFQTLNYVTHPEYTFVDAAQRLTRYVDEHPNGNRLLLSTSSDEITLVSHLTTICDDFGTQDLVSKLNAYRPGWFAAWNDLDPGTLEDIHSRFSLEQVAAFHAFDDRERNLLVLFKLHPLPRGRFRDPQKQDLKVPLAEDRIEIPVQ